ncbi:hypothetical protein K493DRAFT_360375 [Basidiobolus meristosporus CBS 931.73]|uniref:Secreted protein n=1 Tax=Basidiobolus meristosporus CBS 931.73 TaxID=1314790 RepID=A0A1Y1XIN4_9FUNG|nr:hypothetical protein K493DRAFT_360375 [Basidiobolus meristosporus CBS 931.73]|eukprot:ORX85573.1 hypothetical protein K493DRAFT_360375 [Basidiobolus meristosporus CBS 931.73]
MRLSYRLWLLLLIVFCFTLTASGESAKAYIVEFKDGTPQEYIDEVAKKRGDPDSPTSRAQQKPADKPHLPRSTGRKALA